MSQVSRSGLWFHEQKESIYLCYNQVLLNHGQHMGLGVEIGIGLVLAHGKEGLKEIRDSGKNARRPAWINMEFLTIFKHKD